MKKCAYCGRENNDEAMHCQECGTEFAAPSVAAGPGQPRDLTWLEWLGCVLRYAGMIVLIGLLYLLSFGPVARYCCTVNSRTSASTSYTVNGQTVVTTVVRSVSYPRWVGIVYYPAFLMRSASGGNGLYGRYLEWWEHRAGQQ
jgi:hypothetical protein